LAVNYFNRGVVVKELSDDDVRDVFLARAAIEKTAAASLWESRDRGVLAALDHLVEEMRKAALDAQPWGQLVDLDITFHQLVVESIGSPRLSAMYQTLLIESRMAIAALDTAYTSRGDLAEEHAVIVSAIRGENILDLYDEIDAHLDNTARIQNAARAAFQTAQESHG
jgi:DNA-binding GntR family transcriptional regulator